MMKLAEALMERSDLKTRIEELAARLNENAKVQEGDEPAENPAELLDELNRLYARLERLMTLVNLTNARTLSDGAACPPRLPERTHSPASRFPRLCVGQREPRHARGNSRGQHREREGIPEARGRSGARPARAGRENSVAQLDDRPHGSVNAKVARTGGRDLARLRMTPHMLRPGQPVPYKFCPAQ